MTKLDEFNTDMLWLKSKVGANGFVQLQVAEVAEVSGSQNRIVVEVCEV